jgi:sugar lactone lactonase YvrE
VGPVAHFGSLANGDIYAANLKTGRGRVISGGPGTPSVGLKSDQRGLRYVAGGSSGPARVVNVRTGDVEADYALNTNAPVFINDVVLSRDFAWFTDSQQPQLYRVPLARRGRTAPQSAVEILPLGGDWVQSPGFNANGIALTPDRRALLVVQTSTGLPSGSTHGPATPRSSISAAFNSPTATACWTRVGSCTWSRTA